MSFNHYQGNNPFIPNSSQSKPRTKHFEGHNPFTDPKHANLYQSTINECNQLNGRKTNTAQQQQQQQQQQQRQTNTNIVIDKSNPYLNDPNLQTCLQQFNPFTNKQYEQAHSARSNGYNNYNNNNNNNNIAKSQQPKTNDKIAIRSDNPYHPTNFYKDKEEEQKTAKELVSKYRVNEVERDLVINEYAAFCNTLPTMNMINEQNDNNYDCKINNNKYINQNRKQKSPSNSIISNDMIPGQIRINRNNFTELNSNDRVWIRNDESGDWEIYNVIKMEKTNGNTYIGTFKIGNKKRIIWQDQCRDFTIAKFANDNNNNNNIRSPTSTYIINNIFKINDNQFNGNFVLKEYNQFNGMAQMKDVRTGHMVTINLNNVKHVVIG